MSLDTYLDWIGREWASGTYECELEQRWPYGPKRDLPNPFIEVPDLSDPKTWSYQPPNLFTRSREELIAAINAELSSALYYLTVIVPRSHGVQFGNQHKEAVRMFEFIGAGGSGYSARRAKQELEHLDDQGLRAVLLIIEMAFENLC